jgi:hypothetical protein
MERPVADTEEMTGEELDDFDPMDIEDDPFDDPDSGDFFDWAAHYDKKKGEGDLLLIIVDEYVDHVPTVHTKSGEKSPAIRADIIVLTGDDAGGEYSQTLIFGKSMVPQLKKKAGKKVLCRLAQGEAKRGQNPPWQLRTTSDVPKDREIAKMWLRSQRAEGKNPFQS